MANDIIDEDFESGTNGAVLLEGSNFAGTGVYGTSGDPVFTNATVHEGSLAAAFSTSAGTSVIQFEPSNVSDSWTVFYIHFTAVAAANTVLFEARNSSNTKIADMRMNNTGTLTIRNESSVAIGTLGTALATNTWHRIAIRVFPNQTNGMVLKTYEGVDVDSATPTQTIQGNLGLATTVGIIRLGVIANATFAYTLDHLQASSTAEPIPSVADTVDPVAVVSLTAKDATYNSSDVLTACTFDVTAAASTDNVGVTGYSWSDNAAGGSFSSTTVAAPTWTPPDLVSGPWTLTCTVSDAAANTDAAGVVVDVPAAPGTSSPITGIAIGAAGAAI